MKNFEEIKNLCESEVCKLFTNKVISLEVFEQYFTKTSIWTRSLGLDYGINERLKY